MAGMPGMSTTSQTGLPAGTVKLDVKFPKPRLYKVWGQFSAQGQTITAPFVVRAE
jgi:hypothetical protein